MNTDTITQTPETQSIAEGRWHADPSRSRVEFRTPTLWGLATVRGHFDEFEGSLDLQADPAIQLTIDADSLTTNNRLRERHLRSGHFFDIAHHPQVRFVSDAAELDGDWLRVRGRLYAAGKSLPLELDATVRRVDGDELEVEARTQADHRKLGMSSGLLGIIPTPSELIVRARLAR